MLAHVIATSHYVAWTVLTSAVCIDRLGAHKEDALSQSSNTYALRAKKPLNRIAWNCMGRRGTVYSTRLVSFAPVVYVVRARARQTCRY